MLKKHHIAILLLAAAIGCTDTGQGPLDPVVNPPFISRLTASPDGVNIDTLSQASGNYAVTTQITATVLDPDGLADIKNTSYRLLQGTTLLQSGTLTHIQDTKSGAIFRRCGHVQRPTHRYRHLLDRGDIDRPTGLIKQRRPPAVHRHQTEYPPSDRAHRRPLRQLWAIPSAWSRWQPSPTPTAIPISPRFPSGSGTAPIPPGNRWSTTAAASTPAPATGASPLRPPSKPSPAQKTSSAKCAATDRSGAQGTLSRAVSNRAPVIVQLNVPATITRPDAGNLNITFALKASDPDGLNDIDSVYFRNLSSSSPVQLLHVRRRQYLCERGFDGRRRNIFAHHHDRRETRPREQGRSCSG